MKKQLPIDYRLPNRAKTHQIVVDATGNGRDRLTCMCGSTLVRQDFMGDEMWKAARLRFMADHPFSK